MKRRKASELTRSLTVPENHSENSRQRYVFCDREKSVSVHIEGGVN